MRIANEAAVAGLVRLPPTKRADLAVKLANRRRNERHSRGDAKVIDDQPRRKIIATVDHNINAVEQCGCGLARHPLAQRLYSDIGIDLPHDPFNHIDLGRADISLSIKYLTLEIGAADDVIINYA